MASVTEGGSCKFERLVLADFCSWVFLIALFVEKGTNMGRVKFDHLITEEIKENSLPMFIYPSRCA